jgi:BolA protein
MSSRIDRLRAALETALAPTRLDIEDEGHLHAGHAGARKGGHFRVTVVAEAFTGLSPIARHRRVYEAAAELMQTDIHALAITARTPAEAAAR